MSTSDEREELIDRIVKHRVQEALHVAENRTSYREEFEALFRNGTPAVSDMSLSELSELWEEIEASGSSLEEDEDDFPVFRGVYEDDEESDCQ